MDPTDSSSKPNADPASTEQQPAHEQPSPNAQQAPHEALYDRFAERARELFEAGQEKTREAMDKAMESARQQLAAAGEFSAEQGEAFKKFMQRDLEQTAEEMRAFGQDAKERLNPSRLGAGALSSIARALEAAGSALQNLSRKAEDALRFRTGEITAAGTLTCIKCGQTVQLKRSAHIPPCPSCHATEFRKGY